MALVQDAVYLFSGEVSDGYYISSFKLQTGHQRQEDCQLLNNILYAQKIQIETQKDEGKRFSAGCQLLFSVGWFASLVTARALPSVRAWATFFLAL